MPVMNLYGNELNRTLYQHMVNKFYEKYGLDISSQVSNEDILDLEPHEYDIIIGNPPWITFADLPEIYKDKVRKYVFIYEMAKSPNELILGKSRMNLAALIIRASIKNHLRTGGKAIFIMPLSLLLGEESASSFRSYIINDVFYAPLKVFDFGELRVFKEVNTRYGICSFEKGSRPQFPIPYLTYTPSGWREETAKPIDRLSDPLCVGNESIRPIRIKVSSFSKPRQGVNTCGANAVFIFDEAKQIVPDLIYLSNKKYRDVPLPPQFVFPLITKELFHNSKTNKPIRWILIPYHRDGTILSWDEILKYPELKAYLDENKSILQARKGLLIQSFIRKGYWWALLGVGKYSFAPYKVVWEAFGKAAFRPTIFEGIWQANQALHAYMPARNFSEAQYIKDKLSQKEVHAYLEATRMAGTKSWAQPARIERLLDYE